MSSLEEQVQLPPPLPGGAEEEPGNQAVPSSGLLVAAAGYVAILAFLLASFPARNADLWLHLAGGRQLAHGELAFAPHPGLPAGLGGQHTWLYNLVCFGLYSALGGTGLVLLKALLVAATALLMLRLAGKPGWLSAGCVSLALVAMSTRLLLQPATVSCLFLAVALLLAGKARESERLPFGLPSTLPALLVLFAAWASSDRWFVVGLAAVALVWLGQAASSRQRLEALRRAVLGLLPLAAVCLLNPAVLLHPSTLPDLLPLDLGRVASPVQGAVLLELVRSPAGLAWFVLLGLGAVSFFLAGWSWQRFLPWLGLAVLSAVQVRAIPFFAVAAGPVLAWNLEEFAARRSWPRLVLLGRPLAGLLGLALLVCAWPGWLRPGPFEPRRWAVEAAPALEQGAATARRWVAEGKLGPAPRGLHLSLDSAAAFAWFCPEAPAVVDARLAAGARGPAAATDEWSEQMRAAGINHLVLYEPRRGPSSAILAALLAEPRRWPLLYLEGDLAVFGWRDPDRTGPDPFRGVQMDVERLAYRPGRDERVPRQGPEREAEPRRWFDAFWKPLRPRSLGSYRAGQWLAHAEALRRQAPQRQRSAWEAGQAAALVASVPGWQGPTCLLEARVRLAMVRPPLPEAGADLRHLAIPERGALVLQQGYALQQDDAPPALLYLAVRAARRALADDPDDAQAYLVLGESYVRLLRGTRERSWARQLPELGHLRQAQASAAYNQAIRLDPNSARAHLGLGGLYREMGYLDLALQHLRTYLELALRAGPPPGTSAEQFREEERAFRDDLDRLAEELRAREGEYRAETSSAAGGMPVLQRALLAVQKGLAGKARDLLLESHVTYFGARGGALELRLLLLTGRVKEVRDWTVAEHRASLGPGTYHWLRAQALAALGDYAAAREECRQLVWALQQDPRTGQLVSFRELMSLVVAQAVLDQQPADGSAPALVRRHVSWTHFPSRLGPMARNLREEADTTVLRGLLALEVGEVEEAWADFHSALALWKDENAARSGGGLDFSGRAAAQGALGWLE